MVITLEGDRRGVDTDKDITVNGVGRAAVIEGSGAHRHFTHTPGGPCTLTIANLTLRNSEPPTSDLLARGSISTRDTDLEIVGSVFEDNLTPNGNTKLTDAISGAWATDDDQYGALVPGLFRVASRFERRCRAYAGARGAS